MTLILFINCGNNDGNNKSKNKIFINSPVDWGQAVVDDTIRLTTVFHNLSSQDVQIHYVQTPCGCITAIPSSDFIKKNDSVFIDIKYKPMYSDLGYIEKNIFVYLKNGKEPAHFLIKGRVRNRTIQ